LRYDAKASRLALWFLAVRQHATLNRHGWTRLNPCKPYSGGSIVAKLTIAEERQRLEKLVQQRFAEVTQQELDEALERVRILKVLLKEYTCDK